MDQNITYRIAVYESPLTNPVLLTKFKGFYYGTGHLAGQLLRQIWNPATAAEDYERREGKPASEEWRKYWESKKPEEYWSLGGAKAFAGQLTDALRKIDGCACMIAAVQVVADGEVVEEHFKQAGKWTVVDEKTKGIING